MSSAPRARVASLDIGSNTALMLIAEQDERGAWQRVAEYAEITRIAQGLDASGVLAREPIARTSTVLARYAALAREHGVERLLATGTAPFRRAANGAEVARELSAVLGAEVLVVSGEEEAKLSLLATTASFAELDACWIVDIGGASTELIPGWPGASLRPLSLDVGSVRLAERCLRNDPPTAEDRRCLEGAIVSALVGVELPSASRLIGIAGTVTTLAALDLEMEVWDADRVHGHVLSVSRVRQLADALLDMSTAERAALPGVDPRRAGVLHAGAALCAALMTSAEVDEMVVSDRGVRWGRLERDGL